MWNLLRHVLSILLLPFLVVVAMPFWLLVAFTAGDSRWADGLALAWSCRFVGGALILVGFALFCWCVGLFARVRQGTLAQRDPTRNLVLAGPYRFVRNPMIGGVALMLAGQALLWGSWVMALWAGGFVLINHVYFVLSEEPGLERRFGEPDRVYMENVPPWLPPRKPWTGSDDVALAPRLIPGTGRLNSVSNAEEARMTQENYLWRKSQLLRDFNRSLARIRRTLISRFGEEQANSLMMESRQEYEALIPQIPYIGDKNPLLIFLLPTGRYLAIYRVLQRRGRTVEDAGQLIYEMGKAELRMIPGLVRCVIGSLWFSQWFLERLKKRVTESQERQFPGGYVLTFVAGNGRDFDYGVDYTECASCKFLGSQNALELAPYVCAVDKAASEMMGWGLKRTMTLAEGREKCDFRFKKGGETDVAIPQSLMDVVK